MNRLASRPYVISAALLLVTGTLGAALMLPTSPAKASLSDCSNLYVGAIGLTHSGGAVVVFLDSPGASGGSYAMSLADFTGDDRKNVLALLTAAKLAGHRVSITSSATDQCSITSTWYNLRSVTLNNGP